MSGAVRLHSSCVPTASPPTQRSARSGARLAPDSRTEYIARCCAAESRHVLNRVERIARELRTGGLKPVPGKGEASGDAPQCDCGLGTPLQRILGSGTGCPRAKDLVLHRRHAAATDHRRAAGREARRTQAYLRARAPPGANPVIRDPRIPLISTSQGQVP